MSNLLITDDNPYRHFQVECMECGKVHKSTRHIYKQTFGVDEHGSITFRQELKCNKCGNKYSWIFRDKRAMRILDKVMKEQTYLSERDRILCAMSDFGSLVKRTEY